MALDGALIHCLRLELNSAKDCHIDKIHLPLRNEFVFSLRSKGANKKLFISINPENPKVCFTDENFENPPVPPMFCMLLRKHLSGGKITSVEGIGAERIIIFKILSTSEMGDKVSYSLIVELLGHKTNLILVNEKGKILDAARRSDIESLGRLIVPGALYSLPENDGRCDLLTGDLSKAADNIVKLELPLYSAIIRGLAGVSPLICREIAHTVSGDVNVFASEVKKERLLSYLTDIKNTIISGGEPYIIFDENNKPFDFSFLPIKQYGDGFSLKKLSSFSELLNIFYKEKEAATRSQNLKSDILKQVKNLIARNSKKLLLREGELKKSENKETLRIYGELLKANLYKIEKGAEKVTVENFYDPNLSPVTIKLNPTLSPQNNAAKYFKDYKKACTAGQTLTSLIEECKKEGDYLESVLFEVEQAENSAELNEIKAELKANGYISAKKGETFKNKKQVLKPLIFEKNGFKILVGKNNLQNDELTLKKADKNDIWFHTKNIHGSHVILITNGKEPDDDTVLYAAALAAKYSKAKDSNQVPVDYTPVKYVKKPSGAKPGMVIYKTNQTIFANPNSI